MVSLVKDIRSKKISKDLKNEIVDSKGTDCFYCGKHCILGSTLHFDHVIPFSRGGDTSLENLVPCCKFCNTEKLDFTPEEWENYRITNNLSWPPTNPDMYIRELLDDLFKKDRLSFENIIIAFEFLSVSRPKLGIESIDNMYEETDENIRKTFYNESTDYAQKRYNGSINESILSRYTYSVSSKIQEIHKFRYDFY